MGTSAQERLRTRVSMLVRQAATPVAAKSFARTGALWLLARHSRGRLSAREIGEAMGGITTSAITHAKRLMEETLRKSTTFHRRVATRQHKTQPGKTVVMGSHSIVTEWGIYRFTYWFSVPEDAWKTPQSDTLGRTSVCEAGSLWVFLYNWVLS